MKNILIIVSFFMFGCAHQQSTKTESRTTAADTNKHNTVFPHPHSHGSGCGHESKTVGFDTVYLHDGKQHKPHAGHIDEI